MASSVDSPSLLEQRYRQRSLWLDTYPGSLEPRPALPGDITCDVCIVGAGFSGLWTAYYLREHAPDLRVVVLEREIAGFGASGRNGGWASGGLAGDPDLYSKRGGREATRLAHRETYAAIDEIGRVVEKEDIDCGFVKAGQLLVATSPAQEQRLKGVMARRAALGDGPDDQVPLSMAVVVARVRVAAARAGMWSPHGARVDPARLVRGLAEVVERKGVTIYERTPVTSIEPGIVTSGHGTVRAIHVLRCTEAFTVEQEGQRRRYLPLYSLMVATEPLGPEVWEELGWQAREAVGDVRHLFFYAQRTSDDRIAIGGRGAPYRLGSPIDEANERNDAVRTRLEDTIRRHFKPAGHAAITHHWGGALAVPRDWSMAVQHDRRTGVGFGGGYTGHGVAATNITGRTLADLVLERDTELVTLPFVGHRSRSWEPEPLRFVASRAIVKVMGSSDRAEEHLDHTAKRMRLIQPFLP
jgi:glycine/D-amino acid oxidase-like deaminating enzyme